MASPSPEPDFSDGRDVAMTVPPPTPAWSVGMRIGDYELVDVLGRGGMAVVYLARQISLDRLVALKTISATLATDPLSQERFRREARAVAQLDHPGIVSIHESGVLGGAPFYTMDYVDGPDLGRVLRERSLPTREAARLLRRVADAVGYAGRNGIVHRDLKPANVLLDAAGEPRVADFGLALEARGKGGPTLTGDLLGTPPYMAPEILAHGAKHATLASDVYSLGAMLFQMLTGRTPFLGDSPSEILHLALTGQPPAPRLLNAAVPRDLETICLKCLEKEPAGRYRDAGMLADDLGRFLAGEPIMARPVSAAGHFVRWCRRRPALAGMWFLVVALAILSTAASFSSTAKRSTSPPPSRRRARRKRRRANGCAVPVSPKRRQSVAPPFRVVADRHLPPSPKRRRSDPAWTCATRLWQRCCSTTWNRLTIGISISAEPARSPWTPRAGSPPSRNSWTRRRPPASRPSCAAGGRASR